MNRILIISALYPPEVKGGAERAAHDLAVLLVRRGLQVAVLATTSEKKDECSNQMEEGVAIWRVCMPRSYSPFHHEENGGLKKIFWHYQDHFDRRNKFIVERVIHEFQPDLINIHFLQGIGYNALDAISEKEIPCVYTIHDLGLACIKMNMFSGGKECTSQCLPCNLSSKYKLSKISKIKRLGFISPSLAIWEKLTKETELGHFSQLTNPNPLIFPEISKSPQLGKQKDELHFVFAGRIHPTKGVQVLLEAAAAVKEAGMNIRVSVAGTGPDEPKLKQKYESAAWCDFKGFLSQDELAKVMAEGDALCVPSLWKENSPLVIMQAISYSIPVLASDTGGLGELVEDGKNGILLPPGDVGAWIETLTRLFNRRGLLKQLRDGAISQRTAFDKEDLVNATVQFFREISES